LQAAIESLQNQAINAIDLTTAFTPGVSDLRDGAELLSGMDLVTLEPLTPVEHGLTAVAMVLPIIPGSWLRKGWKKVRSLFGAGEVRRMPSASSITRPPRIGPNWRARMITDPRFANGCEGVAQQIQRHIDGPVITIRPRVPAGFEDADIRLGAYRGHIPGGDRGWAYHQVVVKDGRVYDAFTGHQGLPIEEYKALWAERDSIDFGF
jgi:hypothetical protein